MPGDIFSTRNIAKYVPHLFPALAVLHNTHSHCDMLPVTHSQAHLHDDSVISVITYALSEAVGVQHIVIAGHTGCGGAKASLNAAHAAIDKDPSNPTVPCGTPLERWLAPLTKRAIELLQEGSPSSDVASNSSSSSSSGNSDCEGLTADELAIENVRLGIESVLKSDPVQEAWKCSGSLQGVHGVLYHLNTGIVEDLKLSVIHPHH